MTNPTIPDTHADLREASLTTLATVCPDGRPQFSTLWFLAEDGAVRVSLNTNRQKTKKLRSNSAIDLSGG